MIQLIAIGLLFSINFQQPHFSINETIVQPLAVLLAMKHFLIRLTENSSKRARQDKNKRLLRILYYKI